MPFSTRAMKPEDWKDIKHFKPTDRGFRAPERMGYEFMCWLDKVRERAGVRMFISSTVRDAAQNAAAGGASKSAHMDALCDAADFAGEKPGVPMSGKDRLAIVRAALELGCTRVGVYPNGSVHLDRTEDRRPSSMWVTV
jgi:uncharacterized protein YcbK (DUF882 family)